MMESIHVVFLFTLLYCCSNQLSLVFANRNRMLDEIGTVYGCVDSKEVLDQNPELKTFLTEDADGNIQFHLGDSGVNGSLHFASLSLSKQPIHFTVQVTDYDPDYLPENGEMIDAIVDGNATDVERVYSCRSMIMKLLDAPKCNAAPENVTCSSICDDYENTSNLRCTSSFDLTCDMVNLMDSIDEHPKVSIFPGMIVSKPEADKFPCKANIIAPPTFHLLVKKNSLKNNKALADIPKCVKEIEQGGRSKKESPKTTDNKESGKSRADGPNPSNIWQFMVAITFLLTAFPLNQQWGLFPQ